MPIMTFMTRYFHSSRNPHRILSVNQYNFKFSPFFLILIMVLVINACEEGPTQIGTSLLPESDFVAIASTDTIKVLSYTMYDEAVRSDNPTVSYLGEIYDPYFGTTKAGFVSEIRMAGEWDDKPFFIDSIKMYLKLLDVKGSITDEVHKLRISEIADRLYTDSIYYSNKEVALTGFVMEDIDLPVLKHDSINEIEVYLPLEFGQYITRDTSMFFYSNTRPDFRSYFKGLYFQLDPGIDPLMLTLSIASPTSLGNYQNVITFYMHDEAGETKQFYFILDAQNQNASFNRFSHDFTTALPDKKIEHINDGYKDTLSYLQSLNGVYTAVKLPGLENLKNDPSFDNIAVNKARLTIPVYDDGDLYRISDAPRQLYLRYKSSDGSKYIVPDYNIDQYHTFFDGTIDTTNFTYGFNLASYVQEYLNDETGEVQPELEVFQFSGVNNVILKANNSTNPVKFEFTYTKF